MTIADFVEASIVAIRDGIEQARRLGVECEFPGVIEFEIPVGVGFDGPEVADQAAGRLRFAMPFPGVEPVPGP